MNQDPRLDAMLTGAPDSLMGGEGSGESEVAPADAPLDATAQFLTFDAGMYAVEFHAPRPTRTNVGLALPCARLDAIPPSTALPGRAFISMISAENWLSDGDLPTLIRVVGGKAGVLLSIYKASGGMPPPELRIRYIRDDLRFEPPQAAPAAPAESPPDAVHGAVPGDAAADSVALQVLVHAQARGDLRAASGEWAGIPGSQRFLEGFAIVLAPSPADAPEADAIGPAELEYQGILGEGWNTPWFPAGEFCGSRGMALPILGLRIRLTGPAARHSQCVYSGSFVGRGEIGPVMDGEACEGGGQPMDALRVAIIRRAQSPPPPPAPDPKPDPEPEPEPALGIGRLWRGRRKPSPKPPS